MSETNISEIAADATPSCICAFLDLLGTSNLLQQASHGTHFKELALEKLEARFELFEKATENAKSSCRRWYPKTVDFRFAGFSDSYYFFASPENYLVNPDGDDHPERYQPVAATCFLLGLLSFHLMSEEIFLRGGISVGPMRRRGDVFLGKPMLDAYTVESKIAKQPLIFLCNKTALACQIYGNEPNGKDVINKTNVLLLRNTDNRICVNPFWVESPTTEDYSRFKMCREAIRKNLDLFNEDDKIFSGYLHLANIFNMSIKEHSALHNLEIELPFTKAVSPFSFLRV